jgi:membrane fusion protein (multidrug efflux system)
MSAAHSSPSSLVMIAKSRFSLFRFFSPARRQPTARNSTAQVPYCPVLLAIVLATLPFIAACHRTADPAATANQPIVVFTSPIVLQRPVFHTDLPAEVAPFRDVIERARVQGFVLHLYADRGTAIHPGQLLATLEAPDLAAKTAAATQRLRAAQAQAMVAQATLNRDQATLAALQGAQSEMAGAVATNDIHVAAEAVAADKAEIQARKSAVNAAAGDLRSFQALESYLSITAPFSGMVVRRTVSEGSLVGPGDVPLFELQQLDPLRLVIDVPEARAVGIALGRQIAFSVPAYPDRVFTGKVARIAHSVRQTTRTMPVELDVPNPDLALAPGMFAHVQWITRRPQPTLMVPTSAVVSVWTTYVDRVQGRRIERVPVTPGFSENGYTEIFGKLEAGNRVVVPGSEELQPGQQVQLSRPE